MPPPEPDPRHVLIAGDWHGNLDWALHVLDEADKLFTRASEPRRIVIQLGDFGFRPAPANPDLQALNAALRERGMELWFIDGNHDYHPDLRAATVLEHSFDNYPVGSARLLGHHRIRYLPRGTRWSWAGRTWLAVGGAASVDRLARTEGVDWWPEEEITAEQEAAVIAAGPADVLLSHDCPDSLVPFDKMMTLEEMRYNYPHWIPELPRARAHSARLERIVSATGVSRIFHGHYHVARDDYYRMPQPPDVHVTGLDMDGTPRNYELVDVEAVCGSGSRQ
jgi:hypothetical protein